MSMAIEDVDRQRLEDAMTARRDQLGVTWRKIAKDAAISYETLRATMRGRGDVPSTTRRAIERGLQWPTGMVDAILTNATPPSQHHRVEAARAEILGSSYTELLSRRAEIEEAFDRKTADEWMVGALHLREQEQAKQDNSE
jgi:hypothetical protein